MPLQPRHILANDPIIHSYLHPNRGPIKDDRRHDATQWRHSSGPLMLAVNLLNATAIDLLFDRRRRKWSRKIHQVSRTSPRFLGGPYWDHRSIEMLAAPCPPLPVSCRRRLLGSTVRWIRLDNRDHLKLCLNQRSLKRGFTTCRRNRVSSTQSTKRVLRSSIRCSTGSVQGSWGTPQIISTRIKQSYYYQTLENFKFMILLEWKGAEIVRGNGYLERQSDSCLAGQTLVCTEANAASRTSLCSSRNMGQRPARPLWYLFPTSGAIVGQISNQGI